MYYGDDLTFSDGSLSARRAWIEINAWVYLVGFACVALRKESVDRNVNLRVLDDSKSSVALRKESVDRNTGILPHHARKIVALRKESVDRNLSMSLKILILPVALRKESVDRNELLTKWFCNSLESLSARRAWIEI